MLNNKKLKLKDVITSSSSSSSFFFLKKGIPRNYTFTEYSNHKFEKSSGDYLGDVSSKIGCCGA
jgi:hypothetical protein